MGFGVRLGLHYPFYQVGWGGWVSPLVPTGGRLWPLHGMATVLAACGRLGTFGVGGRGGWKCVCGGGMSTTGLWHTRPMTLDP